MCNKKEEFMSPNTHPLTVRAMAVVVAAFIVAGAFAPLLNMAAAIMA